MVKRRQSIITKKNMEKYRILIVSCVVHFETFFFLQVGHFTAFNFYYKFWDHRKSIIQKTVDFWPWQKQKDKKKQKKKVSQILRVHFFFCNRATSLIHAELIRLLWNFRSHSLWLHSNECCHHAASHKQERENK